MNGLKATFLIVAFSLLYAEDAAVTLNCRSTASGPRYYLAEVRESDLRPLGDFANQMPEEIAGIAMRYLDSHIPTNEFELHEIVLLNIGGSYIQVCRFHDITRPMISGTRHVVSVPIRFDGTVIDLQYLGNKSIAEGELEKRGNLGP